MSIKQPDAPTLAVSRAESVKGMHPRDITAAVWKQGTNLSELAVRLGYSEAYLRMALQKPILDAETIIAACIGIPAHLIWPDRYRADGTPDHAKWHRMQKRRMERNPKRYRNAAR